MGSISFIKLKKLDDRAVIPSYSHDNGIGINITAIDVEYDKENDIYIYHTGLSFESESNIVQFLFPGDLNNKNDCYLINSNPTYKGEIQFKYKNRTSIDTLIGVWRLKKDWLTYKNFLKSLPDLIDDKDKLTNALNDVNKFSSLEMTDVEEKIKEKTFELEFAPYKVGDIVGRIVFMNYPTNIKIEVVD